MLREKTGSETIAAMMGFANAQPILRLLGESYLLRMPIEEILALRLPEDPEDDGSTRLPAAVAPRAGCGFSTRMVGGGR